MDYIISHLSNALGQINHWIREESLHDNYELRSELEEVRNNLHKVKLQLFKAEHLIQDFNHVCEDRLSMITEEYEEAVISVGEEYCNDIKDKLEHYRLLKNSIKKYQDQYVEKDENPFLYGNPEPHKYDKNELIEYINGIKSKWVKDEDYWETINGYDFNVYGEFEEYHTNEEDPYHRNQVEVSIHPLYKTKGDVVETSLTHQIDHFKLDVIYDEHGDVDSVHLAKEDK
jgi:hypothetical protein